MPDPSDTGVLTVVCVAIGLLSGLLGGMLGIGGGVVIVPALIVVFDRFGLFSDQAVLVSVATSLAVVFCTSTSAALAQIRARMVVWQIVRRWAVFLVAGSYFAGYLAAALPGSAVRIIIGLFLLFVAAVMLTRWKPAPHAEFPAWPVAAPIGLAGGLTAGLAGIAGGNVIVPTLLYFNTPVHNATATSSALGVPVALAGTLGYVVRGWRDTALDVGMLGYLHYPTFLAIAAASILAAPVGVRLAHRLPGDTLRRVFGGFLVLAAARILLG